MNPHKTSFQDKHVSLFGYGVEGKSILAYLLHHNVASITIYDEYVTKDECSHLTSAYPHISISIHTGPFPAKDDADILFRSPSLRPDHLVFKHAKQRGALVTTATNIFFAGCKGKIIGVTGTKGKGTTAAWITEMLRSQGKTVYLGGNIGISPLDFLDTVTVDDWVVLELSSFQLWDCDASPHIGVIVMVTVDHLDIHKNSSEYESAKAQLYAYQSSQDYCVVNWDHERSRTFLRYAKGVVYKTSAMNQYAPGAYVRESALYVHDGNIEEKIGSVTDISLPGSHNIQNALSAIMAATLAGCSRDAIYNALRSFKGLPHRLEFVGEYSGIRFYDDSFSTTPETTMAAIQAFPHPKILILGGASKGSDFSQLGSMISHEPSIKAIIGIGDEWQRMKTHIHNPDIRIIEGCHTMKDILSSVLSCAGDGDVVLLSPGCASFGMFKNYKERGDLFKQEVMSYVAV